MSLKHLVIIGAISLLEFCCAVKLNGWKKVSKADSKAFVQLTLPVKQSNLELVEKLFWEVSNPNSTLYGKYLSFNEVGNLVKNEHAAFSTVKYLKAIGVPEHSIEATVHGSYVSARMPVALANAAFGTDFHLFKHPESKFMIMKTEQVYLPKALKEHVTHVPHVSHFPHMNRRVKFTPQLELLSNNFAAAAQAPPTNYVTPELLFSYYGIERSQVKNGATQSLFEALGQQFDNEDLNIFQSKFGVTVRNITDVIGGNDPSKCLSSNGINDCGEANLDVQYIMAVAQNAETTYWNIDASSYDPFLDWVKALSNTANLPQVHSISYGGPEESSDDDMKMFNTEVQKLGLRGVTVLVSSGDDGVAGFQARESAGLCRYSASFPASSPYVTAVGATQGPESNQPEIACSSRTGGIITTGGGFSALFGRPSYQDSHVSGYFSNLSSSPKEGYNTAGRGYPDVSVLGYNYAIAINRQFTLESGTSASAPVFAGMITLINDARLAQGKPPLGFLNQALYSLDASTWIDIVSGDNTCTANPKVCCPQGFSATAGWDPVTGLGTPHFPTLKAALVAL